MNADQSLMVDDLYNSRSYLCNEHRAFISMLAARDLNSELKENELELLEKIYLSWIRDVRIVKLNTLH